MASIGDQNWVVWNQGKNPLVNFNFMLRVEMAFDLPCKSVRAFQRELEYEYIQEGGLNDYVHMRRKPISKPFTLEVERYVGVDYVDPLPLGADLVLPLMLFVSRAQSQFVPGVVARTYVFTGCTVMKKTYGDLVADQSGLLVETTTIGYREMLCVDIPWSEVGNDMFGSVQTPPTNAATETNEAAKLKAQGQDYYEQAKAAKEKADAEYSGAAAEQLLKELESACDNLQKAISIGVLQQDLVKAQAGLKGADGKFLAEAAQKADSTAREKEAVAREAATKLETATKAREAAEKALEEAQSKVPNPGGIYETKAEDILMAEQAVQNAKAAEETAKKASETAEAEWKAALDRAQKASDTAEAAKKRLTDAQEAINQARRELNRLQNCKASLTAWKDKGKTAHENCTARHDACKTANDALQKLPDEPMAEVRSKLETVKSAYQETAEQERQVRQALQYVEDGQQALADVKAALPTVFAA